MQMQANNNAIKIRTRDKRVRNLSNYLQAAIFFLAVISKQSEQFERQFFSFFNLNPANL